MLTYLTAAAIALGFIAALALLAIAILGFIAAEIRDRQASSPERRNIQRGLAETNRRRNSRVCR